MKILLRGCCLFSITGVLGMGLDDSASDSSSTYMIVMDLRNLVGNTQRPTSYGEVVIELFDVGWVQSVGVLVWGLGLVHLASPLNHSRLDILRPDDGVFPSRYFLRLRLRLLPLGL